MNEKQIQPIVEEAKAITITDKISMEQATEVLSRVSRTLDELTADKEKLTKPLNEALKAIRDKYRPWETALNDQKTAIKQAMTIYQTEQLRIAEKQALEAAQSLTDGTTDLTTALEALNNIQTPEKTTVTKAGSVSFRKDKVLKVLNLDEIPRHYFDLNETRLAKDLKEGKTVPGATLEERLTPVNKR